MKLTLKPEGVAGFLRGKIVDVYDFPDGWLEVRWKGRSLPYLKNRALQIAEAAKSKSKTPRRDLHRSDMVVSAAPAHGPSDAANDISTLHKQ
jgi:hypothetical protein